MNAKEIAEHLMTAPELENLVVKNHWSKATGEVILIAGDWPESLALPAGWKYATAQIRTPQGMVRIQKVI